MADSLFDALKFLFGAHQGKQQLDQAGNLSEAESEVLRRPMTPVPMPQIQPKGNSVPLPQDTLTPINPLTGKRYTPEEWMVIQQRMNDNFYMKPVEKTLEQKLKEVGPSYPKGKGK